MYIYQPYPKCKYHWSEKKAIVQNAEEDAALGGGWAESPAAFVPYRGPRSVRSEERNLCRWVDEWSVPGLASEHRKKIRAHLLRADGAFDRLPDADPESAARECMRQAFCGIAQVLYDAEILTTDMLRTDIPQLVWDSAIAGGWWRRCSEAREDIFPEQCGHYWIWRDDSRESKELFRAEARDWEAKLLEAPGQDARAVVKIKAPVDRRETSGHELATGQEGNRTRLASPEAGDDFDFTADGGRGSAVDRYTNRWTCSQAALARAAGVHRADLSKWKKGQLPAESDKRTRIEKALRKNEKPLPPARRLRSES